MITFDSFVAFDAEQDLMRFRCRFHDELVLCAVTRDALVAGIERVVSTRDDLLKLYETLSPAIQRAVLYRLQARHQSDRSPVIVGVDDVYHLGHAQKSARSKAASQRRPGVAPVR